jgi:hypothetical protein
MADVSKRVKAALGEARILALASQIVLGFQFQAPFREVFEQLPQRTQYLAAGGMMLIVAAIACLIAAVARHRIVEGGEDTRTTVETTGYLVEIALCPLAITLGIAFFIAGERIAGPTIGVPIAVAATFTALFFWYGLGFAHRARGEKQRMAHQLSEEKVGTPLSQKIDHMLEEARLALPGAQALLGFQLTIVLTSAFTALSESLQALHAISMGLVALAVILLVTPAAYHRLVYAGEYSEAFHRMGSRLLMIALMPLGLGMAGDACVVIAKITGSMQLGALAAALALSAFAGLWFAWPLIARQQRSAELSAVQRRSAAHP